MAAMEAVPEMSEMDSAVDIFDIDFCGTTISLSSL